MLTITEMLRRHGVVGKIVEFHGEGVSGVPVVDRATIANMSPEFGSTCAIFPIDEQTVSYLRFTGRPDEHVALVEAFAKEQGLWQARARVASRLTRLHCQPLACRLGGAAHVIADEVGQALGSLDRRQVRVRPWHGREHGGVRHP